MSTPFLFPRAIVLVVVSLLAALPGPGARANTCMPPPIQISPGVATDATALPYWVEVAATPATVVGRLCPVTLYLPARQLHDPMDAADFALYVDGAEVAVARSVEALDLHRLAGCPQTGDDHTEVVPYLRHLLTPTEPLPAGVEVEIRYVATWLPSITFTTTEALDREGCALEDAIPQVPPCAPPIQECLDDGCAGAPASGAALIAVLLGLAFFAWTRGRRGAAR